MAAVKKRKPKVKARKTPAKKSPVRKKKAPKKSPAWKPAAKRAAPKKKPAAPKKKPAPRAAARPSSKPKPAAAPVRGPLPGEVRVGVVSHYFGHLSVAAVRLEVALKVGDTIRVLGHTSDFRQRVDSMQIEHQAVTEAIGGDEIGLKVVQHAREHDVVYRVPA
jgi:putative protease